MYTNNDKSGERRFKFRAKNLLSPTKERKLFSRRGGEICWKDRIHVPHPPIDSILIVFHAFERASSRKIELYELATLLRACIRVTIRLHVIEWSSWPSVNEVESRFYDHGRRRRRNCFFREKFLRRRSNERGWNLDMENRFSTKMGINVIVSCSLRLVLIIFLNIFELFRGWILRIIDCWKHVSRICKWDGVFYI